MKNTIQPRILYAKNDEDASFMMSIVLGGANLEVKSVKTTVETLQLAQSESFNLYMLDNRFPDGEGFELCRQIRDLHPNIPIMFYSGDGYESDKQKGVAAGADAYIVKPQIDDVIPTILQLIDRQQTVEAKR